MNPPITSRSATDLAAAIRRGELASVEVTRAFLDRIRRLDRKVHAVVALDADGALRAATAADAAVRAGEPLGPLHGLPMTIKDAFRVAGSRTTFGMPHLYWYRPREDCEVVARVRRAGAVVLGRTAVPFACFDWQCRPPFTAECVNLLSPDRTPGGSSGGSAAALAARFTPLEIGSDVAGSIRYPAHCCGVLALRTTVGLIPIADIGPPPHKPLMPSNLTIGPMARTIDDLALLQGVLAPGQESAAVPDRLRVAVTPAFPAATTDADTAAAVRGFADRLRADGHAVSDVEPPFDPDRAFTLWGRLGGYETKGLMPAAMRNRLAVTAFWAWFVRYRLGNGPLTTTFLRGLLSDAAGYADAVAERDELVGVMEAFFSRYDVWVLPVSPGTAIRRQPAGSVLGGLSYSRYLGTYLCPVIPAGTPALVGPVGRDRAGLPIGVQIHARQSADRWLLDVARKHFKFEVPEVSW